MRLRSLALFLAAAVTPLAVVAPADAATPTTEEVQGCNSYLGASYTPDQLVEKATDSKTVTTKDGFEVTLTGVSFATPDGGRCEFITASSADARAKKVGFRFEGNTQVNSTTQVDGQAPMTGVATAGNFIQPLLWFMPTNHVIKTVWAGPTSRSGVVGQGDWSPEGPNGAAWTMTYQPATYSIDVDVYKATPHDRPASAQAIAAAAKTRSAAIAKAKAAYASAAKRAKAAERIALAKARTKKQRAQAIAAYNKAVRKAAAARGHAIAAARAVYADSTVIHDVDYALTDEVLHIEGTVPR